MLAIQIYSFKGYLTKDVQKTPQNPASKAVRQQALSAGILVYLLTNSDFLHIWSFYASFL